MVSDCRCFLEQTKRSLDLAAGAHARCRPTRACPDPEAFDPLFDVYKNVEPSNDSRHLKDRDDIELFFGLTDSLAMLVLMEHANNDGSTCAYRKSRPQYVHWALLRLSPRPASLTGVPTSNPHTHGSRDRSRGPEPANTRQRKHGRRALCGN